MSDNLNEIRDTFEKAFRKFTFSVVTSIEVTDKFVAISLPENNRCLRNYNPENYSTPATAMKFIREMFVAWSKCPRNSNLDFRA